MARSKANELGVPPSGRSRSARQATQDREESQSGASRQFYPPLPTPATPLQHFPNALLTTSSGIAPLLTPVNAHADQPAPVLTARQLGQRLRRAREAEEHRQTALQSTAGPSTPVHGRLPTAIPASMSSDLPTLHQLLTPPLTCRGPMDVSDDIHPCLSIGPVQDPALDNAMDAEVHRIAARHQSRRNRELSPTPSRRLPAIRTAQRIATIAPNPPVAIEDDIARRSVTTGCTQSEPAWRGRRHNRHEAPIARRPYQEPPSRHYLGTMSVACSHCHALHFVAERVQNKPASSFGMCCKHGKIRLPHTSEPPALLRQLLDGTHADSTGFRNNIRQYNAALAFTSLGVNIDRSVNAGSGPYVFRIHGQLYHRIGSLLPVPGQQPLYSQLYIYDPDTALNARMQRNPDLQRDTMRALQTLLHEHHRYAPIYKHAHEVLARHPNSDSVSMRLIVDKSRDQRRYNLPRVDEVAAVLPGDGSQEGEGRDIILRLRSEPGELRRINDHHPAYACLHYVLIFWNGTNGWHYELREHESTEQLTQARFYAYQIFDRFQNNPNHFDIILHSGRLFQQYLVDVWSSTEANRLSWHRHNQKTIRASLYSGLEDHVTANDEADLNGLGQRIVLASSFPGGPRYMQQLFQDAMAIARYYKLIDLFLTMTANPKWPEITEQLKPNEKASDRPDIVARVFQLKKQALIDEIYKNGIFGRTVAYVYTIEFQKRGLPHMHLLIFFDNPFKLREPADVDSCIRAYWPDPSAEKQLFETIAHCMVHGPCGVLNPHAPCMENGKCTKGFPKAFQEGTTMDSEGYPLYHRPDDGRSFLIREQYSLDNQWIVPYNPYLSAQYNCHINVEASVSFHAIKYITKYIHKGPDRATLAVSEKDEIKRFVDARYISSQEAVWKLLQFKIHKHVPSVERLQVHLPGQHLVTYNPDEDAHVVLARASHERTMLTAYFASNADLGARGAEARRYTYQEFPRWFVWKANKKQWDIRQQGNTIGRMYFVSPVAGERYYLRTLLTVVRGATSFKDLRTVHRVVYPTFREACIALGLLEDDGEWRLCLQEAAVMQVGVLLRQLFATMLIFCNVTKPEDLWIEFWDQICYDLGARLRGMNVPSTPDNVFDYGLFVLDQLLRNNGHELKNFPPMPLPVRNWSELADNPYIAEQLNYDTEHERQMAEEISIQFNIEQSTVFNNIIDSIEKNRGDLFFVNGAGGTGKTFLYRAICSQLRSNGVIVLCAASSGIAALLLAGGRTAHSTFKIPVENLHSESTCSIRKESQYADMLQHVRLIIWDEAGNQSRFAFEAVDRALRNIMDTDLTFGGITAVFGGDFQQTLPVVPRASREMIVAQTLQRSPIWACVKTQHLSENMRVREDPAAATFSDWLLDVGHGRTGRKVKIPDQMQVCNLDELIMFVYGDLKHSHGALTSKFFMDRMILAACNNDVDEINNHILATFPGEAQVFVSADSVVLEAGADQDTNHQYPLEYLRSLGASGLPAGEICLKPGCPIILLRNLAPLRGLCNGTCCIVISMSQRVLKVKIMSGGQYDGNLEFIPRIALMPSDNGGRFSFLLRRRQFPIRLAFAMTINKAQGQSVKHVGLDLRVPIFAHGQLYVALSRATSSSQIKVLLADNANGEADNVVYPEVLLD